MFHGIHYEPYDYEQALFHSIHYEPYDYDWAFTFHGQKRAGNVQTNTYVKI